MQYFFDKEESIIQKITELENTLIQSGIITHVNFDKWCDKFEIKNPDVVHSFNDVILPQKDFQNNESLSDYLALCSIQFGYEYTTYQRLHPNRRKLYYFWFYRLNFVDKTRLCNHLIDEDDYIPMQSTTDKIVQRQLGPFLKKLFPNYDFTDKNDSLSYHMCCDETISELFTCPPCTPVEHGQFVENEDNEMFCWDFFVSRCTQCDYKVAQIDTWYQQNGCLACYYFETVLNQLHKYFIKKNQTSTLSNTEPSKLK